MLNSTASFINCVGGANGDNPTEITRSDVDTAIRTLVNNNAYTISDMIEGEDRLTIQGDLKVSLIDMEAQAGDMAQAELAA